MPHTLSSADAIAIADHSSDGILLLARDGTITYANAQSERLFRQKAENLVGHPYWEIASEASTPEAMETVERVLERGLAGRFEIFFPRLYAWHAVTAAPRAEGAALFIRDVTDRMRLLRDDAVRRGIYDVIAKAPVAIAVMRGVEHRFEMVNEAAVVLLGGRDVEGMSLANAFPELEAQGFVALLDSVFTSGQPYHASEVVIQFRRGTDTELTEGLFDVTYQPLRDADGTISGILSISVDVTSQVRARRQVEEMAGERAAILSQLAEGVVIADRNGRIRFVNEVARALHGRAELDVAPSEYAATYELLTEAGDTYPPAELPLARAVIQRETVNNARWRIRRPDGSVILVEGSAVPVSLENGSSAGAVLTMHEVGRLP